MPVGTIEKHVGLGQRQDQLLEVARKEDLVERFEGALIDVRLASAEAEAEPLFDHAGLDVGARAQLVRKGGDAVERSVDVGGMTEDEFTELVWSVARSLGTEGDLPILRTEISPEKAQSLRQLHRLCDWVITLDRNAGIEYFDSPRDNKEIYDAYVIDCVPEREDLGCLQLITSTSNL